MSATRDNRFAIVIPALNPARDLAAYCASLRAMTPTPILLVDDGSRQDVQAVFDACRREVADVEVLHHEVNRGKGRALKTAFSHLLETCPNLVGCVTCDSDGQHAPKDVVACLDALEKNPAALVLGCRDFSGPGVPWKSRFGNNSMRWQFRCATGRDFLDTQTGLRAISAEFMRSLLGVPGERFEFETKMLLVLEGRPLLQIPIETIYVDGNRETHFRLFADSVNITWQLVKFGFAKFVIFTFASLASFGVDIGLFSLLYYHVFPEGASGRLFWSTLLARAASLLFNFFVNRHLVFRDGKAGAAPLGRSFIQYLLLAAVIYGCSYLCTWLATRLFPGSAVTLLKAIVDFLLFLASFTVQRAVVFRHRAAGIGQCTLPLIDP